MNKRDFSSVKALIFDLDGTLIDSKQDLVTSVNAMLAQVGRGALPAETIASYVGSGASVLVSRALGPGAAEEEVKKALAIFLEHYEQHKLDTTRPYPGVEETLAELSSYPLAVLTNKPSRASVRILEGLGLSRYFRVIYGGNSFETKKPDPLGARTILHEFRVPAEHAMMVGDSEVDVQTARNAGMLALAVNYGFGTHDRLAHPADIYLDKISDLVPLLNHAMR
jgi:phosphoglycolate phosphatase